MIVVDTSAWIEFFRASERPADRTLQRLIRAGADLAVTEIVVMELLAGTRSDRHERRIRTGLVGMPVLPLKGLLDFEAAAALYRACRLGGETLRRITDCLVAVSAIAAGASVLHADRDFDAIARHSDLAVEPLDE